MAASSQPLGTPPDQLSIEQLSTGKVRVPGYVVYRDFAHETVMLNLRTGKYHGLNRSGGTILETLENTPSVAAAVSSLAARYEKPEPEIEQDVFAFCVELLERSLIELDDGPV